MGVKGDLVAALVARRGLSQYEATQLLKFIFDEASDPNFAYKYADEEASLPRGAPEHNERMSDYWRVIGFVRAQI